MYMYTCMHMYIIIYMYMENVYSTLAGDPEIVNEETATEREKEAVCILYMYMYKLRKNAHIRVCIYTQDTEGQQQWLGKTTCTRRQTCTMYMQVVHSTLA